jgi:hypothetical protein
MPRSRSATSGDEAVNRTPVFIPSMSSCNFRRGIDKGGKACRNAVQLTRHVSKRWTAAIGPVRARSGSFPKKPQWCMEPAPLGRSMRRASRIGECVDGRFQKAARKQEQTQAHPPARDLQQPAQAAGHQRSLREPGRGARRLVRAAYRPGRGHQAAHRRRQDAGRAS